MKKLGNLLILASLGLFMIGCAETTDAPPAESDSERGTSVTPAAENSGTDSDANDPPTADIPMVDVTTDGPASDDPPLIAPPELEPVTDPFLPETPPTVESPPAEPSVGTAPVEPTTNGS